MLKFHREIYQVLYEKNKKTQILFHPAILAIQFTSKGSYVKTCADSHIHNHGHLRVCFFQHGLAPFSKKHIHQPGFVWGSRYPTPKYALGGGS